MSAKWIICPNCGGDGKVLHDAIRYEAITREDFAEDPDFEDQYFGGGLDVQCPTCWGTGKVRPEEYAQTAKIEAERARYTENRVF